MGKDEKIKSPESIGNRFDLLYSKEILPHFQDRLKTTAENVHAVPNPMPVHVGMQQINPRTKRGKYFVEFTTSSTIHGLNHFAAPHRHPIERFLAALFIFVAFALLVVLSMIFWNRYQYEATITTLDHDRNSFTVMKPAIAICPIESVERLKFPSVFKRYGVEDTLEARKFFAFLSNMTYENMHQIPEYDGAPPEKWIKILWDLKPEIKYIFTDTEDKERELAVKQSWWVTERGVCVAVRSYVSEYASLNYWSADNWTVLGIPENIDSYDFSENGDNEPISITKNAMISILDPGEMVEYQYNFLRIVTHSALYGTLSISEIVSDRNIYHLSTSQRKCKFPWDGGLKMWPIYTFKMCVLECRFRIIKERCGCHPHFARPMAGIPVCNVEKLRCVAEIKDILFLHKYPPLSCGCIPNCNTVNYAHYDRQLSVLSEGMQVNTSIFSMRIDFPTDKYCRVEIYGLVDFLTGVGGAAGLFLGASLLSFVEIFYFLTLRLCVYCKRWKRENQMTGLQGSF